MSCEEIISTAKAKPKFAALLKAVGTHVPIYCTDFTDIGPEGSAKALTKIDPLGIEICRNRNSSPEDIERSLLHELVHVFDYEKKRYDLFSCDGLAASEIRAAREAECSGKFDSPQLRDICIRRRATLSTANLFPREAEAAVNRNFEFAVKDLEPFHSRADDE